ncbi:class I SAM-dependent methyltransferase [Streptomyces hainanensis]|uniref:Class I SAM-dependent methyltransferase n=1 Tax=Streptomyces hainanensis TaxID=402648 RepID=A0A4R4T060_9ACTN|nr:class I SAM-dependent methyltransferase [Streptomyces hainanensis]TDC70121.1 class I SAM-dependent methyltransferase [Streptomyces hainanensis]
MSEATRTGYSGTGPGAITPDGCAVEHWLRLRPGQEPEIIASAVPAGAGILGTTLLGTTLLELGCGVGRLTRPLVERGFTVTAVDESPEMLAHVTGVRTIRSTIEGLDLGGERFDVVLLASFLVHAGDPAVRAGILRACRRHVADAGQVLIQRESADWHLRVPRESRTEHGVTRVASADPVDADTSSILVEYEYEDARWTQRFLSHRYTEESFAAALAAAGLAVDEVLTEDGTWVRARPMAGAVAYGRRHAHSHRWWTWQDRPAARAAARGAW